MILESDKILVISPHADDESLGLGGTMVKWLHMGAKIKVILATTPSVEREKEFKAAMKVLGVKDYHVIYRLQELSLDGIPMRKLVSDLDAILYEYYPTVVLYPYPSFHQDHRAVAQAMHAALRPSPSLYSFVRFIGMYEYPYVTWSDNPLPESRFYVDIKDQFKDKLKAMRCYKSQLKKSPREMVSIETINTWAKTRGSEVGLEVAEVIYPLRFLL